MTRVPTIDPSQLSAEQKPVYDEIASTRGGVVEGPFAIWIHTPTLAAAAAQMGDVVRLGGSLEPRLFEVIVLIVARQWTAQYEWYAHADSAIQSGVDPAVVEAIRTYRVPALDDEKLTTVYELTVELTQSHDLIDATYDRALELFGFDQVSEIVTVIGYYTMVAMMVTAFDSPVPGDVRPLDR